MALKIYELNGLTFQFDDQDVPAGAVEVKPVDVIVGEVVADDQDVPAELEKAVTPANKAVTPINKAVSSGKPATTNRR